MRRGVRWQISAGAILLFALFYFLDSEGIVSAMIPAVLIHEIGHVLALRLCGSRVTRVCVSLTGVELDYAPGVGGLRAAACFLSGPLFGAAYALAALAQKSVFWRMSGASSALLTAFNLLPILPLDGGRAVALLLTEAAARRVFLLAALALLAGGAALAVSRGSFMALWLGAWLTLCNLKAIPGLRPDR